ncbi:MAG: phenylalanine--tRNA ligase beta subunit-related protein [Bdellovibrionales bacterium]
MEPSSFKMDVNQEVRQKFPDLHFAFALARSCPHDEISRDFWANRVMASLKESYTSPDEITSGEEAALYKNFYKELPVKFGKVSTPCKQAARILNKGTYHPLFPILDACMLVEYTTLISFQLYDADKISGNLHYALAKGGEKILTFHEEEKECRAGDLLLQDGSGVVHSCAYGNHKEKMLSEKSKTALIRLMKIPHLSNAVFIEAQKSLSSLAEVHWLQDARADRD